MIRVADVYQTIGIFRFAFHPSERLSSSSFPRLRSQPMNFCSDSLQVRPPMEKEKTLTTIPVVESFEALGYSLEQPFIVLTCA